MGYKTIAETSRLWIREFVPEDLEDLYRLYEAGGAEYVEPLSADRSVERARLESYCVYAYGFYGTGFYGVVEKATGELIGRCGIRVAEINGTGLYELGYLIRKDCREKGYGREAVLAVMDYGKREVGIEKLYVRIHKDNEESVNFIEKLGFNRQKTDMAEDGITCLYVKNL